MEEIKEKRKWLGVNGAVICLESGGSMPVVVATADPSSFISSQQTTNLTFFNLGFFTRSVFEEALESIDVSHYIGHVLCFSSKWILMVFYSPHSPSCRKIPRARRNRLRRSLKRKLYHRRIQQSVPFILIHSDCCLKQNSL
jgi:hypothetical protein